MMLHITSALIIPKEQHQLTNFKQAANLLETTGYLHLTHIYIWLKMVCGCLVIICLLWLCNSNTLPLQNTWCSFFPLTLRVPGMVMWQCTKKYLVHLTTNQLPLPYYTLPVSLLAYVAALDMLLLHKEHESQISRGRFPKHPFLCHSPQSSVDDQVQGGLPAVISLLKQ